MGQSVVNAGCERHYNPTTGAFVGWTFYLGMTGYGHLPPNGDPMFATSVLNSLRAVAQQQGRAAWEAALPGPVRAHFNAHPVGFLDKLWRRFRFGPVFTE